MPRTAIVGIGNTLRADDGAGVLISARLKKKLAANSEVKVYQTGTTPENHLIPIVDFKPKKIYLVDTCDFGGKAGDFKVLPAKEIKEQGFSTHSISLSFLVKFLSSQTDAEIFLIAIQPEKIATGKGLSFPVKNGVKRAVVFLENECTRIPDG